MKTEVRTETFTHPTAGDITREYIYTWDETKDATLDVAIAKKSFLNKEFYVEQKIDANEIDFANMSQEKKDELKVALGLK